MSEGLRKQTVSGVMWSFIERFSVQGVQFIITIIMARILTPADYGLIGMLAIFMGVSQVFIDGGFSKALIQAKEKDECDYSTVFYINLGISILFYAILFFAAPYIAAFYNQPLLTPITRVYTFNLVINSLAAVNRTILVIRVDFKTQSKISLASAFVSGLVGIYCAYTGWGVWSLVVQMMTSAVMNVLLGFFYVRWFPLLQFSVQSFKKLFAFGSKLLVASVISTIYDNIYTLVIGKRFPPADLGYYSRAHQFADLTGTNISGILARVCFPVLSKIQDDDVRLLTAYKKYIKMTAFIMFPVILLLSGIAKPLILTILGTKWAPSIQLLHIIPLAFLFNGIVTINLNLLYVKGRSDLVLRLEIIKKSIAFTILFISMFYSLTVICLGLVLYSLIGFYLNTIYTKKLLNYGFFKQIKDFWPYLLASISIMVEGIVIGEIIDNHLVSLIISIVVGGITYLGICHATHLFAYEEVRDIAKPILNKIWHSK